MQRQHFLYLFVAFGVGLLLFHDFLFNNCIIIGDSDRINTFLNFRKFQIEMIKLCGLVPAWYDNMFMGMSLSGIAWLPACTDIFAYIQSLFPIEWLYQITTYTTITLVMLAMTTAYVYLEYLTQDKLAAVIGSILYISSTMALQRAYQVDNTYFSVILIPLGLYLIRKYFYSTKLRYLVGTACITAILLFATFLQEALYVLFMYAAYTAYLGISHRKLRCFLNVAVVGFLTLLMATPRLWVIYGDTQALARKSAGVFSYNSAELLRWIFDGMFGRTAGEVISDLNIHEGLQIYTSVPAFVATIFMCYLLLVRSKIRRRIIPIYNKEIYFHVMLLLICLMGLFTYAGSCVLYNMFMRLDFLHGRISIVMTMSCIIIVAFFIKSLNNAIKHQHMIMLYPVAAICAFILLLTNSLWVSGVNRCLFEINSLSVLSESFYYVAIMLVATMVALYIFITCNESLKCFAYYLFIGLLTLGALQNADLQFTGEQTKTLKPFANHEFYVTKTDTFKIPNQTEITALHSLLETNEYRTALLAEVKDFQVHYSPHLATFWQLRLVEGYGTAVPKRLAALPWGKNVHGLHALRFNNQSQIKWDLLSMLNVKYLISFQDDMYFNDNFDPMNQMILENPYLTTPRAFFAKRVVPYIYDFDAPAPPSAPRPEHVNLSDSSCLPNRISAEMLDGHFLHLSWQTANPYLHYRISLIDQHTNLTTLKTQEGANEAYVKHHTKGDLKIRIYPCYFKECSADYYELDYEPPAIIEKHFPTSHFELNNNVRINSNPIELSMVEGFPLETEFDTAGTIKAEYRHDRVHIMIEPGINQRFLVLNELYHPAWQAFADGQKLQIYPVNLVMRGVIVPPNTAHLDFMYVPLTRTYLGLFITLGAFVAVVWFILSQRGKYYH